MKFPICNQCIKSQDLCSDCKKTSKNNSIGKDEIEHYKAIHKALRGEKHIKDVEIKRIISSEKISIIVCNKTDVPKLIGKNGIIAKKIEKKLGKDIRIVSTEDAIKFFKDILHPSNILGINVVYNVGNEIYRIRLPQTERYLIKISPEFFKQISIELLGKHAELDFE